MSSPGAAVRVGTSGFSYRHWKGVLYPAGLRQSQWLEHYAGVFDTVELNVTFYRTPREETFSSWRERTPSGFVFALKGPRQVTHVHRLRDCREALARFLDGAAILGDKLGPLLWQLPPSMVRDDDLLVRFLLELNGAAPGYMAVRHAFEFRHESWFTDRVYGLLAEHGATLCCAHSERWPTQLTVTCPWCYLRFHGGAELYGSRYTDPEMEEWASRIRPLLRAGTPVFAYFNNDAEGHAVSNAFTLKRLLLVD
jgi:uncharacterized protein YecE (DUF72 family)